MEDELYPLLFHPVPQLRPWSGDLLAGRYPWLGREGVGDETGECWQVVDSAELQSKVANGKFEGQSLRRLIEDNPAVLVGKGHPPEDPFPLCARLLDIGSDQPLGVHPADAGGRGERHERSNAKYWYAIDTEGRGEIMAGIRQRVTGQQLMQYADTPKLRDLIRSFTVRPGDSFLIPPGIVHGIGAGNLVWELQERPVSPYRLSDWQEETSEVTHEERNEAFDALVVESRHNPRISREASHFQHTRRIPLTPHCPYFLVDEVRLFDHIILRTTDDSFHLLMVVEGTVELRWGESTTPLEAGQLCCIPASLGEYKVLTTGDPAEFLRVRRPRLV